MYFTWRFILHDSLCMSSLGFLLCPGWIGTNLCISLFSCLFVWIFLPPTTTPPDFCCRTWILSCGEENLLPCRRVTLCALLSVQDPLSGKGKTVEHLEVTTNGRASPSCPPLVLWESVGTSVVLFTPMLAVFKLQPLAYFKLPLFLPGANPLGSRADFCRMIHS